MSYQAFSDSLSGGFQGAGQGAQILGGLGKINPALGMNPWAAGGLIGGGALIGGIDSLFDSSARDAGRINVDLGRQERAMGKINLQEAQAQQLQNSKSRRSFSQFGDLFSKYMRGFSLARPSGQGSFAQDVGGP